MRTNPRFVPRTPRPISAATAGPDLGAGGNVPIAFDDAGTRWRSLKPVDWTLCQVPLLGFPKSCTDLATFEIPRVCVFFPRVAPFIPHVLFSSIAALSLSFSIFLEERERKRRLKYTRQASTGFNSCNETCPRVDDPIHGFSVDEKRGNSQFRRGLTSLSGGNPRSTERNARVPPAKVSAAGENHGR